MHSSERKLSEKNGAKWHASPVVSSLKSDRRYTILPEKRLAVHFRGYGDRFVSRRITDMTEALYKMERSEQAAVEKTVQLERILSLRAEEEEVKK